MQALVAPDAQAGKDAVLNLNTNHQSTVRPFSSCGPGVLSASPELPRHAANAATAISRIAERRKTRRRMDPAPDRVAWGIIGSCVIGCQIVNCTGRRVLFSQEALTMAGALPSSPSHIAEESDKFKWDGNSLEPGIALALSGGGFRAMLFHAGALLRLNELGILSRVTRISSVSGGSIAAGYLACVWDQLGAPNAADAFDQFQQKYVEPILSFSREKIDVGDILTVLLPWTSAAEQVAASYDKSLFHNVSLQDIPDQPRFVFCATNMQTGVLWRFSKPYAGDYVVGRLDKPNLPLSKAVTASSAFPPFLSPLVLSLPQGSLTDWPGQPAGAGGVIDPTPFRARVLLTDGGVYDNHGLEPVVKRYMTLLVSDGGAPFGRNADVATDPIRQ